MRTIKRLLCCMLFVGTYGIGMLAQENQSYFLHTIEKGQSLYSIASMYGVSQADIVKLNPGSDEKIYIGRTLRIPRVANNTQKETERQFQDVLVNMNSVKDGLIAENKGMLEDYNKQFDSILKKNNDNLVQKQQEFNDLITQVNEILNKLNKTDSKKEE